MNNQLDLPNLNLGYFVPRNLIRSLK